ncbi:MAG: hypothetical protein M1825_004577 [Sarcosagium campestre]|nr:MAG: hypothetical protein M1825_004577 [Sarcosagium campestre]
MEIPPTYEEAISHNPLPILASNIERNRLLSRRDLRGSSLVSRSWASSFQSALWNEPTAHFGSNEDDRYYSFTTFLKCLKIARVCVRASTSIIDFSRLQSSLYGDSPDDWLLTILTRLPHLQAIISRLGPSLIVATLQNLSPREGEVDFETRVLDLCNCTSISAQYLPSAFRYFTRLEYLDLSSTCSVRALNRRVVPETLQFPQLQVLKLRNLGLTDDSLFELHFDFHGVWSLDISNNTLTDKSAQRLTSTCFSAPQYHVDGPTQNPKDTQPLRWLTRPDAAVPQSRNDLRVDESAQRFLINSRSQALAGPIPDAAGGQLTHLYISGNRLTSNGVCTMLAHGGLQMLDCGDLQGDWNAQDAATEQRATEDMALVASTLTKPSAQSLRKLRIHHRLVTGAAALMDKEPSLWGRFTPNPDGSPILNPPGALSPLKIAACVSSLSVLILTDIPSTSHSGEVTRALRAFFRGLARAEEETSLHECCQPQEPENSEKRDAEAVEADFLTPRPRLRAVHLEIVDSDTRKSAEDTTFTSSFDDDDDFKDLNRLSAKDFSFFPDEHDQRDSPSSKQKYISTVSKKRSPTHKGLSALSLQKVAMSSCMNDRRRQNLDTDASSEEATSSQWTKLFESYASNKARAETNRHDPLAIAIFSDPDSDVVTSLSRFRAERRRAHQETGKRHGSGGLAQPGSEGHWSGDVVILRRD